MRKARELKDGAVYHVTARANRKEMILDNKELPGGQSPIQVKVKSNSAIMA